MLKRSWAMLFVLTLSSSLSQAQAQGASGNAKPTMSYHGVSPRVDYLAEHPVPLAPGAGQRIEPEMEETYEEPTPPPPADLARPFIQTVATTLAAAVTGTSFEGPGTGLAGFQMTGAPPDMTLAVGPNHIVTWVNSQYAVFSKAGALITGPLNGSALFAGIANECGTTNRGDPILQYDRLADRWVLSQFAFAVNGGGSPIAPYYQCFAVSTSGDPAGTYVRYSVQFSATAPSGLNDYGKLGIWPDAYYTSYNMFQGSPAGSNSGAALCASDRAKMLAGDPTATTLCAPINFYGGGASFLPADLDGTTLPVDQSQGGLFLRLSTAPALRLIKLKPNFAAGTVTLNDGFGGALGTFVDLPLPATTRACNGAGGACVPQPTVSTLLDTLGDRLMYRLAFRSVGGIERLVVAHAVDPDGAGARDSTMRWYEIRNPLGNPADPVVANRPTIFQNGTYDPGANADRWMGSIAMDGSGNIMMGYSRVSAAAGQFASIGLAGREPGDPINTLQAEIIAHTGTGAQSGTLTRWGDYSTMQVDPADDRTFWYIGEYLSANGTFNWRTRIVSASFPAGTATLGINDVTVGEGNAGSANAQFTITRSNNNAAVSVTVNTASGTATSGSDFTPVTAQVVNFTAGGALTATVDVPILGDTTLEPNETYTVTLSSPTNATISDGTGAGTINNDDGASIAINDVTQAEGNAGSTAFTFTATLTGSVQGGFTVPFSTANGSATQPADYASNSGTLTFAGTAGETQTVTVQVVGDGTPEGNDTFTVGLGTPSKAGITVSDGTGLGTITNDDGGTISINDVSLTEGNAGNKAFTFTATLTGTLPGAFTVPFGTTNGTAVQPGDYASNSGTLNFAGTTGETQAVTVQVAGDGTLEANETFTVDLGAPSNGAVVLGDGSGLGTITNDDSASVAINDVTLAEGNGGNTAFTFTATLTGSVQGGFTVPFNSANGTASQPGDYASNSGTLTFAGSGGETQTATIQVVGDTTLEPNETFTVGLGTPSNAAISVSDASGLGTITNDDSASVAINDVTLAEGNAGSTAFTFTATLTGSVQGGFTVPFNSANGTASQPGDYASNSGTLTFAGSGGETQTATVQVVGDTTLEPNETFTLGLGTPSNAAVSVSDNSGLGTITNDDSASVAINDVTLPEGNVGNTQFSFTATLTGAVQGGFSVPYGTANGSATEPGDYASKSGTLTFSGSAGETQSVTVQVSGDATLEPDETYTVDLGSPSNAAVTVSDGSGLGTITNDDSASIAINDVTLAEGNAGSTAFTFTATLTGSVQGGFTVPFNSANGTASQPGDYASNSGTLTFAGSGGETQTATVQVVGDTTLEPNETFTVGLGTPSNAAVSVSDASGLGTITNDDSASIAINDVTLAEGNGGNTAFTFTATLTGSVQGGFTVPFNSANGTASQPGDYASNSGTLTFAGSGGETQTATIQVVGDTTLEPNETFTVGLGTPSNAAVGVSDASGLGTITNDDSASIAINDVTLAEGNAGNTAFTFTVTLTGAVQGGFSVPYGNTNGTATKPADFANASGNVVFAGTPGETQPVTVQVVGDAVSEFDETFTVDLGAPGIAGISVADAQGLGTITNDDFDADVSVSVDDGVSTIVEGNSTTYTAIISNTSTVIDVAAVAIGQSVSTGLGSVAWTCTGSGGAACPAANGTGVLAQTRAMPKGSSLTYQITTTVAVGAPSPAQTTVTATVQAPNTDADTGNNSATDSDVVLPILVFTDGFE